VLNSSKGDKSKLQKQKRREAARKAWETIRKKRKEAKKLAAKNSRKIEEFISPRQMAKISHPEDFFPLKPVKVKPPSYRDVIIHPFSKAPPDIVCGKFWELRWAFGCPFNCAYCYLRGTCRGRMRPSYVKLNHVLAALDEVFNDPTFNDGKPAIFNSGELADSLMNPPLMEKIADKFEEQNRHKLLLLSKCGTKSIEFLVKNPRKQVICAWSLNAPKVAKLWEKGAPSVEDRIQAAKMVQDAGYDVWIRIDPIFPIEDWKYHYELLLLKIFHKELKPKRIILGTPRGLWKTIHYAKKAGVDMSWTKFFEKGEKTGWGLKLPFNLRKEIYQFMYEKLKELGFDEKRISICKETKEMWNVLGFKYVPGACQCYGNHVLEHYK